ncbi:MAG: branched-chain amino acid ABC transporter permease [Planctomycetota bacterium]|nr:branched-chain amino acid ABC transporter permease [Planctomycetota bacterium]
MTLASFLPLAIELGPQGFWWMNVLFLVAIYSLLGLSLNLINGYARMFSLGHHGFWAMGAYGAAWFTIQFHGHMPGVPLFLMSCVFAMGVAAVGGLLIGLPCLRLRGDYLAIATLGFGEIVRIAIQNSPREALGGSLGLEVPRVIMDVTRKTKADFRVLMVAIGFVLVALTAWAIRNYIRSARGRAMLAVAQDETAAGLLGINPVRSKVLAFVAASAVAGLAGAVYAHYQGIITPLEFNFMEMVKIFLIVVLGGLGSISGCVFAAFLLIFVEQWLAKLPADAGFFKDWWQVEYAAILVLLMIFRPRGIFGPREITDVWRDLKAKWAKKRSAA